MNDSNLLEKSRQTMQSLGRLMRHHRAVTETAIGDTGLHKSSHMMLFYLYKCSEPPAQNDIATRFGISAAAVTSTLKKLEQDGYICRTTSEADSRVRFVSLTDKGRDVIDRTRRVFDNTDEQCFYGFSADEIAQFSAMIERIQKNLDKLSEDKQ